MKFILYVSRATWSLEKQNKLPKNTVTDMTIHYFSLTFRHSNLDWIDTHTLAVTVVCHLKQALKLSSKYLPFGVHFIPRSLE